MLCIGSGKKFFDKNIGVFVKGILMEGIILVVLVIEKFYSCWFSSGDIFMFIGNEYIVVVVLERLVVVFVYNIYIIVLMLFVKAVLLILVGKFMVRVWTSL